MKKADYEVFKALNPFFGVVLKGLKGLVDGEHYFDTFAEDAIFESRYDFPGWPRVNPTTGKPIKQDIGELQINMRVWGKLAALMGDDLATEAGNPAFGKWLFDKQGSPPWNASRDCRQ